MPDCDCACGCGHGCHECLPGCTSRQATVEDDDGFSDYLAARAA